MYCRLLLFSLSFYILSCSDRPVDGKAVQREMESREIKRVSDADIINKGTELAIAFLEAQPNSSLENYRIDTLLMEDLDSTKQLLIEAYQYQLEAGEGLTDFQEKVGASVFVYHPIVENDSAISLITLEIPVSSIVKSL